MIPIHRPSTPMLVRNGFVKMDSPMARGFSFITSGLCGSSPSAIAGRLSVRRLMNSRCTGANGTGRLASDAYKTARIAAKFPESRN